MMKINKSLIVLVTIIFGITSFSHAQREMESFSKKVTNEGWYKINANEKIQKAELIDSYRKHINLTKDHDLILTRIVKDDLGYTHERRKQYYKGIQVEGAELVIHEKNDLVKSVSGYVAPINNVDGNPRISESRALDYAKSHIGGTEYIWETKLGDELAKAFGGSSRRDYYPEGELVIVPSKISNKKSALAYKFFIFSTEPEIVKYVYVNATNGQILLERDAIESANQIGTAITKFSGQREITTDHFEGGFRLKENRGPNNVLIHTRNIQKSDNITDDVIIEYVDSDNFWNNFNENQDEEGTDIHWGQEVSHDYFLEKFGRNSWDGEGGDLLSFGNWGNNVFNAQAGNFGPGGVRATRFGNATQGDGLTMLDVVGHEVTHNVVAATAQLFGTWNARGLNESFADIFGVSMSFYAGLPEENIWILGDEVGGIRNMQDPKSFNDPDTYLGEFWDFDQSTSVHNNGNVQDFWYYLLVNGGNGVNDNGDSYSVTGIGLEKAEQIAYRNLAMYLTSTSEFFEARAGSLQAAEDLFGQSSQEYTQVANAWYAVGVGEQVSSADFGIVEILPESSCEFLTANESIGVTIKYFGGSNIATTGTIIPISYSLNGAAAIQEDFILPNDITGGEQVTFTFSVSEDFSSEGRYDISALIQFPGDPSDENNELTVSIFTATGPINDVGIGSLIAPDLLSQELTNSETVSVNVVNYSCETIMAGAEIPLTYSVNGGTTVNETLTLSENLISGESTEFTFSAAADLTISNSIQLVISTDYSLDPKSSNDEVVFKLGAINSFPYSEDFESGQGGWIPEALSGDLAWEFGSPNQAGIDAASSGINAWMTGLNSNYPNLSKSVLVSPAFNFASLTTPTLCFDNFFIIESEWDAYVVEYSTDGENWTKVNMPDYNGDSKNGNTVSLNVPWYSGTNGGWVTSCVSLPDLGGEANVRFRFHFESDEEVDDEGVAIDNISISEIPSVEIGLVGLTDPVNGQALSNAQNITIQFENAGSNESLNFDASYTIDGGTTIIESVSATLATGETGTYTFNQQADMSELRTYVIDIEIIVPGDANETNNSISGISVFNGAPVTDYPYNLDFDLASDENIFGWVNDSSNDQDFTVESVGPFFASNGIGPAADNTSGEGLFASSAIVNSNATEISILQSPEFDLTGLSVPILEFYRQFWENSNGTTPASISLDVFFDGVWNEDVWSVSGVQDAAWTRELVDLSDFSGVVRLRFRNTNNDTQAALFALDDLSIFDEVANDLALLDLSSPVSSSCLDDAVVAIDIANLGTATQESFDINYTVEFGGSTIADVTETITATFVSNSNLNAIFSTPLDMGLTGDYIITVSVLLSNDENPDNNSQSFVVTVDSPISDFEYVENFETFSTTTPEVLINGWYNVPGNDIEWQTATFTPTGDTGPTGDNTSGSGKFIYVESSFEGEGFPNKTAQVVTPCFDVSALSNPILEFWYHMQSDRADAGDRMGTLSVDVFDGVWNNDVWTISGNQGQDWNRQIIQLGSFGDIIKLRFSAITGDFQTSDIAIDDLRVFQGNTTDVGITGVVGLEEGCGLSENAQIGIQVTNFGLTDIVSGSLELSYTVDGQTTVSEIVSMDISSFETIEYTFDALANLGVGEVDITFSASLAGDENLLDNESMFRVNSLSDDLFEDEEVSICEGETYYLKIDGQLATDIVWSVENTGLQDRFFATESGTYGVTVTYANGCSVTDEVTVTVNPNPEPVFDNATLCAESIDLTLGQFDSYLWQDGSTESTFTADQDGLYFVTVSDANNCYATVAADVVLTSGISADFTFSNDNTIYTFNAVLQDETLEYEWDFGDGRSANGIEVTHGFIEDGSYDVTLTVSVPDRCSISSTQNIVDVISGIDELTTIGNISIYPNPTSAELNVSALALENDIIDISILDLQGRTVLRLPSQVVATDESSEISLNVSSLPAGTYILKLTGEDSNSAVRKFMISE